jgi:Cu/Ag efflux protein CusF
MLYKLIAATAASALLATTTMAAVTQTTKGEIKTLNVATRTVTLNDNVAYKLPANFDASKLKVGEKVSLTWEMKDGARAIEAVNTQAM